MRSIHELTLARDQHQATIAKWKEEDDMFPGDPIYTTSIIAIESAIAYLNRRIAEASGHERNS